MFLGHSEDTGWSALRVTVMVFAAFFGIGFVARAIRAVIQRRRFARIAAVAEAPDRGG